MTTTDPPFDCAVCRHHIGKTAHHVLVGWPEHVAGDRVLCARCMGFTRHLHGRFYPDCTIGWHDLHDHPSCSGTRAGIAHLLRRPPEIAPMVDEAGRDWPAS